ncbi:uncharacterized protein LOC128239484 isoform X1 [Mya arenaria]|uniref:uncharacterized protein LOC128239484 isoform X1 n=2 Tax=Mya arenaria TaxID=6604 RepID=UPI0022E9580C|nr:uncharacterized protein LOC128239484 isoform X1 [Mya arenaria]XP_052812107.1 uncharacterized protein LOC128239484 isoform X1 [Mya arenaria]XP_052812108.1 uncharacterized protein LOC128239484 isoform X1 [Mya arenaria]XP_052812109.1 uncharacterized protein LOC128239484 isoform X1 [Mya arenaria]XP_052812110.1 uncharacterized protein LOC128239484 isoform X1 [Mya arenaria]XP_052812111.1 uncharacterized protein LOC128239484 isoform X1 [Mya arenaria]XP_052812112.1 uncharacterized protein LOC12823
MDTCSSQQSVASNCLYSFFYGSIIRTIEQLAKTDVEYAHRNHKLQGTKPGGCNGILYKAQDARTIRVVGEFPTNDSMRRIQTITSLLKILNEIESFDGIYMKRDGIYLVFHSSKEYQKESAGYSGVPLEIACRFYSTLSVFVPSSGTKCCIKNQTSMFLFERLDDSLNASKDNKKFFEAMYGFLINISEPLKDIQTLVNLIISEANIVSLARHQRAETVSIHGTQLIDRNEIRTRVLTAAPVHREIHNNPVTRSNEDTGNNQTHNDQQPFNSSLSTSQDDLSIRYPPNLYHALPSGSLDNRATTDGGTNSFNMNSYRPNETSLATEYQPSIIAQATPDDSEVMFQRSLHSVSSTDDRSSTEQIRHNMSSVSEQHKVFDRHSAGRIPQTSPRPRARYPAYGDNMTRLGSYSSWGRQLPTPFALTSAGFFFTGEDDLVRCYECGIGLKDFSEGDDPLREHAQHAPRCRFIADYFGSQANIDAYTRRMEDPDEIRRRGLTRFLNAKGTSVTRYKARSESFRSFDSRLSSYRTWPTTTVQRPFQLAEAGLYYTGREDHVRCFACDGGLRRWDPEDDPWIEHCKWFPACPFAREEKGDEYIALVQATIDNDLTYSEPNGCSEQTSTLQSNTDLVAGIGNLAIDSTDIEELRKTCTVDMGFSKTDFDKAISDLAGRGNSRPTIEDVISAFEVLGQRQENYTANQRKENLLEENQRLRSMLLCFICQRNQVNALYLPCTDHRLCMDCAREYSTTCPVCQRPVKDIIKTFMS